MSRIVLGPCGVAVVLGVTGCGVAPSEVAAPPAARRAPESQTLPGLSPRRLEQISLQPTARQREVAAALAGGQPVPTEVRRAFGRSMITIEHQLMGTPSVQGGIRILLRSHRQPLSQLESLWRREAGCPRAEVQSPSRRLTQVAPHPEGPGTRRRSRRRCQLTSFWRHRLDGERIQPRRPPSGPGISVEAPDITASVFEVRYPRPGPHTFVSELVVFNPSDAAAPGFASPPPQAPSGSSPAPEEPWLILRQETRLDVEDDGRGGGPPVTDESAAGRVAQSLRPEVVWPDGPPTGNPWKTRLILAGLDMGPYNLAHRASLVTDAGVAVKAEEPALVDQWGDLSTVSIDLSALPVGVHQVHVLLVPDETVARASDSTRPFLNHELRSRPLWLVRDVEGVKPSWVPRLIEVLRSAGGPVAHAAFAALRALGPQAAPALPYLRGALRRPEGRLIEDPYSGSRMSEELAETLHTTARMGSAGRPAGEELAALLAEVFVSVPTHQVLSTDRLPEVREPLGLGAAEIIFSTLRTLSAVGAAEHRGRVEGVRDHYAQVLAPVPCPADLPGNQVEGEDTCELWQADTAQIRAPHRAMAAKLWARAFRTAVELGPKDEICRPGEAIAVVGDVALTCTLQRQVRSLILQEDETFLGDAASTLRVGPWLLLWSLTEVEPFKDDGEQELWLWALHLDPSLGALAVRHEVVVPASFWRRDRPPKLTARGRGVRIGSALGPTPRGAAIDFRLPSAGAVKEAAARWRAALAQGLPEEESGFDLDGRHFFERGDYDTDDELRPVQDPLVSPACAKASWSCDVAAALDRVEEGD